MAAMNELTLDADKLRDRDEETLARLFDHLLPLLRQSATLRGATDLDADDIVSEVLLNLLKDPDRLAEVATRGHLTAYCLAYARNAIVHRNWHARKRAHYDAGIDDPPIHQLPTPEDSASIQEAYQLVAEALGALDETSRDLVMMRYVEGLTTREIAEVLGITATTARVRLHRIMQQLRRAVESKRHGQ
jgi:RNA polymerase sigma-70 factor (ECF subfamily)